MSHEHVTDAFALGAEAFAAGASLSANPFREDDARDRATVWAAGWMDAASRKRIDVPDLAAEPPPPDEPRAPVLVVVLWAARVFAFCAAWGAEARASRARAAASCAWAEADRWDAYAAVFRAVAERPTLRALAEVLGMHLPSTKR